MNDNAIHDLVDVTQQWFDFNSFSFGDYIQLFLIVIMIGLIILVVSKPSWAFPPPKHGMEFAFILSRRKYIFWLLAVMGLITAAAGILTGRLISAIFWSLFAIFNIVLLIFSSRERRKRELSELESTNEI